ncbi:MAG TPA: hypothetical protein VI386_17780 [Candidatus Sulfotelmatobacter sp.]
MNKPTPASERPIEATSLAKVCPQCWSRDPKQLGELCVSTMDDATEREVERKPHSWHSTSPIHEMDEFGEQADGLLYEFVTTKFGSWFTETIKSSEDLGEASFCAAQVVWYAAWFAKRMIEARASVVEAPNETFDEWKVAKWGATLKVGSTYEDNLREAFEAGRLSVVEAPREAAPGDFSLRLLKVAAQVARRAYLPSLERCRTIGDAREEIYRYDDIHARLAQELKEIWQLTLAASSTPQPKSEDDNAKKNR